MVHVPPPAETVPTQSSVSAKSVLGGVMVETLSGAVPALTTETVFAALLTLNAWLPKATFAGTREMAGLFAGSTLATKAFPATPAKFA